ncbi:MAG: prepilin peptidase [Alphaproteobacteria bacterium]|nr:prepilin peptidase [Alphaproteobacteria bacterium]
MYALCLACLAGLLVTGSLIDIECRRLPNWLTSAVAALYALSVAISPSPVDWMSAFVVAGLVFALGFAGFAFGLMGGGDVKLMAGLSLWAGVDHIVLFLTATSLAGGLLAIVMLSLHRWARSPLLLMLPSLSGLIAKRGLGSVTVTDCPSSTDMAEDSANHSLPYGVAIAAGGFAVIYALLQL